ncbi:hypothetical protein OsJ_12745 [Oryza sativa Japonica Group]|uniref:Uncharacterized protein n=1 Tax=Oryza sativa subsp. japonica TaxID=39947 RepID=B9F5X2_ORYSJ|nr:hypothetical protein OsJ_12745 [Oryza sativa Japonica Group]
MPQKAVAAIRTEPQHPAANGYNYFSLLAVTNHRSYVGFLNQTAIADQVVWRFCKARRRRARQAVCCGCGVDVTLSRAATIICGSHRVTTMAVTGSARLGEESYIEFRERDAIEVANTAVIWD